MTGAQFGHFHPGLIGIAIVVAIAVWLLHWLYLRSSKERAFVRTGLGGQKVVLDGGAFVLPIVHDVIPVNMNTLRLEVARGRDKALITKDRMRVDVIAEFYVRVAADAEAVAAAAQTLGQRTLEPEQLKELVEGKFVDALRTAAAEMTMEELHEKRGSYVKRVREAVAGDLTKNGLELEAASLTQLDQTAHGVLQPEQRLRRRGPDAADRADRAPQEAAQRRRAGHADRDPQQEPRGREAARSRSTARASTRASRSSARSRSRAPASAPSWPPSARSASRTPRARRSPPSRRSRRRASAPSSRWSRSASARSARCRPPRSSAARRWSWPSSSVRSRSRARARRRARRRRRPTSRAPRPCRPRRRSSPRARSRWPSARRRSS